MDTLMNTMGGWFDGTTAIVKLFDGAYITGGISGYPEVYQNMSNVKSSNIKANTSILGVTGSPTVVDTADAWLDPAYLVTGYSGYDDGVLKQGTMVNHTGADSPANSIAGTGSGRIYVRPQQGYYDGSVASYVNDSNFIASNIVSGKSIFGVAGSATIQSLGGTRSVSGTIINYSLGTQINVGFQPSNVIVYATGNNYVYMDVHSDSVGLYRAICTFGNWDYNSSLPSSYININSTGFVINSVSNYPSFPSSNTFKYVCIQ
jgi:hypothetical protein